MSSGIAVGELFPRHSKDRKGYIYVHDQGKDLYFEKKYIGIVNIDGEKNEISFIMTKEYSTKIGKVIQKGLGNYIIKFKNKKVFVESAKMLESLDFFKNSLKEYKKKAPKVIQRPDFGETVKIVNSKRVIYTRERLIKNSIIMLRDIQISI